MESSSKSREGSHCGKLLSQNMRFTLIEGPFAFLNVILEEDLLELRQIRPFELLLSHSSPLLRNFPECAKKVGPVQVR